MAVSDARCCSARVTAPGNKDCGRVDQHLFKVSTFVTKCNAYPRAGTCPIGDSDEGDRDSGLMVVGIPSAFFAKSEPAQNRCDAPMARNLSSELDCAGGSSLSAKIHFLNTDVTRCLALCKVRLLPRDFPSITVRWACK